MKTKYKYIVMILAEQKPKTQVWTVWNDKSSVYLGEIKWLSGWRQYCFFPEVNLVFSAGCLDDISHFINQLMGARK